MPAEAIVRGLGAVVVDVHDLQAMASFWGEMLGQEPKQPRSGGDWVTVGPLHEQVWLTLQKVPETKEAKNRLHLDFVVDDVVSAVGRIVELGGRQLTSPSSVGAVVMADPEGNEFCIGAFGRNEEGVRTPL